MGEKFFVFLHVFGTGPGQAPHGSWTGPEPEELKTLRFLMFFRLSGGLQSRLETRLETRCRTSER